MNRRTALLNLTGLALIGLTETKNLLAMSVAPKRNLANGFHRFKMGDLEFHVVTDGHIFMKPIQPNFAPGINKNTVQQELNRNFASKDNVELSINVLVVKSEERVILIDTGCGANFGKDSGWLIKNLAEAGIQVNQVTDVVITHAHPDHISGLTNENGKLLFPNSQVYLSRIEHDFWMSKAPDFSKSKIKDSSLIKFVTDVARKNIIALGDKLHLFEDGDTILDCVTMQLAPGHTPGHCIAKIFSKGEELYHIADLVHSAVLVVEHPEWGFDGDNDFNLAVASRIKVMDQLAKKRSLVFSYHLPWPGLGHMRNKEKAFEWIQQPMMIPD